VRKESTLVRVFLKLLMSVAAINTTQKIATNETKHYTTNAQTTAPPQKKNAKKLNTTTCKQENKTQQNAKT